jgi:hypothetical protein
MEVPMLRTPNRGQVRFIALLAKAARDERDSLLGNISEKELGEPKPGRGEHNPTEALAFEPLSLDSPQALGLREAITSLSPEARSELYALMRIGQGHLGAKQWDRRVSETESMGDEAITALLTGDVDLQDHLLKGLYELKVAA